ncbi:MAG: hypothetical protein JWM62_3129 [Frankiales bacterium]|nr:hypothetical protein [Frankiales bacterium]
MTATLPEPAVTAEPATSAGVRVVVVAGSLRDAESWSGLSARHPQQAFRARTKGPVRRRPRVAGASASRARSSRVERPEDVPGGAGLLPPPAGREDGLPSGPDVRDLCRGPLTTWARGGAHLHGLRAHLRPVQPAPALTGLSFARPLPLWRRQGAASSTCHSCGPTAGSANGRWRGGRTQHKAGYVMVLAREHPRARQQRLRLRARPRHGDAPRTASSAREDRAPLNGLRGDDRPENLELWTRPQPAGIRAADAVRWADEVLSRYDGQRRAQGRPPCDDPEGSSQG